MVEFRAMKRMKPLVLVLFVATLAATVAACNSGPERTILIVYSPHGEELLTEYELGFEAVNPDIDVRFLDMGSQDALDRIRSERANPQADIWFGAPSTNFAQAEREGLLAAYRPTWADAIADDAHSAGDFWYGTYQTPEVIAYNSNMISADDAPQDWDDVLDPKWADQIVIRDPIASGTMRTIFAAMIIKNMPPAASDPAPESASDVAASDIESASAPGYEWLRQLDANTKEYTLDGTILIQKMIREEAALTLWNMPDVELRRALDGYPLDYVLPSSGTPVLTDAIAIVAGTENMETAQAYYEFVTNEESLALAAELFFRIPSRNDIPTELLPEWQRDLEIPRMDMDWDMVEQYSQEWMEYWDSYIRGGP
jgi:iron(III) transport system substrate-binding protein